MEAPLAILPSVPSAPVPMQKIRIFTSTWNMGNAEPIGIEHIFPKQLLNFDIYSIGLQESTFIVNHGTSSSVELVKENLLKIMGDEFILIDHCVRVQLQLYVFASKYLKDSITNVQQIKENTGFLHVFPNKGGLLISMQVGGTKLAFISCHLTAHEGSKHCDQRNMSIMEILGGARIEDKTMDVSETVHHLIWMGDMNYRTTFDYEKQPKNHRKHLKLIHEFDSRSQFPSSPTSSDQGTSSLNRLVYQKMDAFESKPVKDLESIYCNAIREDEEVRESEAESMSGTVVTTTEVEDVHVTVSGKGLGDDSSVEAADEIEASSSSSSTHPNQTTITKHHSNELFLELAFSFIHHQIWSALLLYDELNREIASGRVMNGFIPLQPSFPPTFKRTRSISIPLLHPTDSNHHHILMHSRDLIEPGPGTSQRDRQTSLVTTKKWILPHRKHASLHDSDIYQRLVSDTETFLATAGIPFSSTGMDAPSPHEQHDLSPSTPHFVSEYYHNKRIPSYTDRILYKSHRTFQDLLTPLFFESCEEAISSDHKPVRAGFELQFIPRVPSLIRVDPTIFTSKQYNSTTRQHVLRLKLHELKGFDLEEMDSNITGGKSDPYLVVTTDPSMLLLHPKGPTFSHLGVKSSVIQHDVNPVWKDETLAIYLASTDIEVLKRTASLVVTVWDKDQYNADDYIGGVSIPFRDFLEAKVPTTMVPTDANFDPFAVNESHTFPFQYCLRNNSAITGSLSGKIEVLQLYSYLQFEEKRIPANCVTLETAYNNYLQNQSGCNCSIN